LLDLLVLLFSLIHLLGSDCFGHLTSALQRSSVAHKGRRALNALLKTVLFDEPFYFFLKLFFLSSLFLLHFASSEGNVGLMLLCRGRLLSMDISIQAGGAYTVWTYAGLHRWVDILICLVHVYSKVSCRLWLMELEWLRFCWLLRLLKSLHFGNERLLNLAEVGHRTGSRRLEAKHRLRST